MKKSIIKKIASVLCVILLFSIVQDGLRYILVDDTAAFSRLMMHQLHTSKENIDIAFVGSSHVYRAINPQMADESFGAHTFNCGTSSQMLDGSLAMIKELLEKNDVDTIYLEMYFGVATGPEYKTRTVMLQTNFISDYISNPITKASYLLNGSPKELWVNNFISPRRKWDKLLDFEYIADVVKKKQTDGYKNYKWVRKEGSTEYYVDRGFVANDNVVKDVSWVSIAKSPINLDSVSQDWENSLQEVIKICKKKDVKLVFFVTPMPEWSIAGKGNYDEYYQFMKKKAEDLDIGFYDFNLVDNKYFSTVEKGYFKDEDHLNTFGAEQFSKVFCDFFTGAKTDIFYDSYEEKLESQEPAVFGASELVEDTTNKVKTSHIISNKQSGIEYEIVAIPEDGEKQVMQEFTEENKFSLPINEHGTLQITWRTTAQPDKEQIMELQY